MYDEIKSQARAAMQELLELAAPRPNQFNHAVFLLRHI